MSTPGKEALTYPCNKSMRKEEGCAAHAEQKNFQAEAFAVQKLSNKKSAVKSNENMNNVQHIADATGRRHCTCMNELHKKPSYIRAGTPEMDNGKN